MFKGNQVLLNLVSIMCIHSSGNYKPQDVFARTVSEWSLERG